MFRVKTGLFEWLCEDYNFKENYIILTNVDGKHHQVILTLYKRETIIIDEVNE
jgi:hypothetical protein